MLRRCRVTLVVSMLIAFSLAGCDESSRQTDLTVHMGQPVHYTSTDGEHFVARYGSLSDGSLHFVKVQMPGGQEYTLPQVVSASGVRYTDEKDLVWWTHQRTVLVEIRGAHGNWETKYSDLREVPEKN